MVQTPSSPISVAISGKRWWKGFTAELTITNTSGRDLASWSTTFDTPHRITGTPWGVTLTSVELGNGLIRYTLTGSGWGASLKAGASVKVGFNGSQGVGIGNEGALTADLLLAPGTAPSPVPSPEAPPSPTPTPAPATLQVVVGGTRWWNGFTAELTITNNSGKDLKSWSTSFDSPHQVSGAPWGATLSRVNLGAGLTRYTLTGSGWAAGLKAGASVKVGFSGSQGISIGNEGALTAAQLFGTVAPPSPPSQPTPPTPEPPSSEQGYGEALRQSFLFYEAQRSGDLDEASNRIPWRGDSGLRDGRDGVYFGDRTSANLQAGLSLDLTGGYHDAGDHGKFGLPLATTLSTLAWGGLAFERGYTATGQRDELLSTVKWGTDYLLKAHGTDATGATRYFVAQVGHVPADHALWSAPESQTIPRPAMAVTPTKPGSDVAAGSAAALASASILFRRNGEGASRRVV
jgi:endoglucanase